MCETGQVIRQAISIKAKHGPRLRELPKVTVRLTVDAGAEDREVFRKYGAQGLREVQICRMAEEALEQGGVLTQEDLADILQVDVRTIRRTIKQLQQRGVRVQTRGQYHDIGPGISHKAWIVSLYLEYKTYSEIARTTRHTTTSIKRYITDFGRVSTASKKDSAWRKPPTLPASQSAWPENTPGCTCATTPRNTPKGYRTLSSRQAPSQKMKGKKGAWRFHENYWQ